MPSAAPEWCSVATSVQGRIAVVASQAVAAGEPAPSTCPPSHGSAVSAAPLRRTPPHPLAQHSALQLYRADHRAESWSVLLAGREDRTGGRGWPDWRPTQQQPPASHSRSIQLLLLLLLLLLWLAGLAGGWTADWARLGCQLASATPHHGQLAATHLGPQTRSLQISRLP